MDKAERKQSMGYDWHPDCLKCEECGKILKPGQHAEVHYSILTLNIVSSILSTSVMIMFHFISA